VVRAVPVESGMSVRDFRDLVCWRLSYELKCEVVAFTSTGPAARDFKYRDQIVNSSASAPRNIAEGFGRFRPTEFARFLEYACASLDETRNHLIDGHDRGYLTSALYTRLSNLTRAARKATTNLMLAKKRQAVALGVSRQSGVRAACETNGEARFKRS
jgi:four helix bundle protein